MLYVPTVCTSMYIYLRQICTLLAVLKTLAVVPKCTHFLESYFEIIVLGWICSVHCWMLHALKGNGFDCLFTLVSIKMEHSQPVHVCTNVCIIYAHTGAGLIRVKQFVQPEKLFPESWFRRSILPENSSLFNTKLSRSIWLDNLPAETVTLIYPNSGMR